MCYSGHHKMYTDLEKAFNTFNRREKRIPSSVIAQYNLQLSSEAKVFDILGPGLQERTYDNPWMNCSSMDEYLDVLSAHDWWKNIRALDMGFDQMPCQPESDVLDMGFPPGHGQPLDMGFNLQNSPDPMHNSPALQGVNHLVSNAVHGIPLEDRPLDMGFNAVPVQHVLDHMLEIQPEDRPLDMGFNILGPVYCIPEQSLNIQLENMHLEMGFNTLDPVPSLPDNSLNIQLEDRPLDMGFNTLNPVHSLPDNSLNIQPEDRPLDMGFNTLDPVHSLPNQSLNIQLEDKPLDMGFDTLDLAHGLPDNSSGELEPIGFVIQCTVGDLQMAIHRLEMERVHDPMSPEVAIVRDEVLESTEELLLAFQLISVYQLST
ncbi:hypothetical protein AZE42_09908 [Rhizopogon vesiculosus]|uniref:Uncharacterized protein n=1 Tax=Rhizopogon vesiculosus TaxID=180088 RepID=A0A1J8QMK9_9AGAM|nr:hypothetical protein AZE42_09908 [Rhizopogon vesiculosus]